MSEESSALRLFDPDGLYTAEKRPPGASQLSAQNTLLEFFYRHAWPDILAAKGDSQRTRQDYQQSLAHWQRFTGDPALAAIDKRTCSKFLRVLATWPGQKAGEPLSANTRHKHWQNIQRLLDWTGPQGRHNRNGAGLLLEVPYVASPRKQRALPRPGLSLEEIHRWLSVLPQAAAIPKVGSFDPGAWWRGLIILAYNTGLRPGTMLRLRWEWLDGQVLRIPTGVIKGGGGGLAWVNQAALAALEPLRRPAGLILRWPDWPCAETTLNNHRVRLQRLAEIRALSLYAFRRAFATECAKISTLAVQLALGHEGAGTRMVAEHYIDAIDVMSAALERLPQPDRPLVQRTLF